MPSARYWRQIPSRYRLEGARCVACGRVAFPARRICPACRKREMTAMRLTPRARVITSTVVHVAPAEFQNEAPYALALVETPEGARMMAQVVDGDIAKVRPGTELQLEFRRIRAEGRGGILCYGYKGVPLPSGGA